MSELEGQQSIDDALTRVRRTDPDTSRQAALNNAKRRPSQKVWVLGYLMSGNACANEIANYSKTMYPNVVARRLNDLENEGYARRTGHTRLTNTGSRATVWEITKAGEEAYLEATRG